MPEETPDPQRFRSGLPQYDSKTSNTLPVLFGILRRILWLLSHFGIIRKD